MKQMTDISNTGEKFTGELIPDSYADYILQSMEDSETFLDVLKRYGVDIYVDGMNDETLVKAITQGDSLYVTQYRVELDKAKAGLAGEYNTFVGVKLYSETSQFMDFYVAGKEEAFQAMYFDPILDVKSGKGETVEQAKARLTKKYLQDYADALQKERQRKYFEQILNSGLLMKTPEDYQRLYDKVEIGYSAPVDVSNLTPDEMEVYCLALDLYADLIGYPEDKGIVWFVPNEWYSKLIVSGMATEMIHDVSKDKKAFSRNEIYVIHGVTIVPFLKSKLTKVNPEIADVIHFVSFGGNAVEKLLILRDIDWRTTYKAMVAGDEYAGNVTTGVDYLTGTYFLNTFLIDNTDEQLTNRVIIGATSTFSQDVDKVIKASVNGQPSGIIPAVNRTLANQIAQSEDNSVGTVEVPTNDGSYVDGSSASDKNATDGKNVVERDNLHEEINPADTGGALRSAKSTPAEEAPVEAVEETKSAKNKK